MSSTKNSNDLSWAAGFIDGEGCVTIAAQRYPDRKNPSFRPMLSVSQNVHGTLEHLRQVIGIEAPIYKLKFQENHRRQPWALSYSGQKAIDAMTLVLPYLVRKGPEVLVCQELWNETDLRRHPGPNGFPPEIWNKRWELFYASKNLK